jgi:hypothetical protein
MVEVEVEGGQKNKKKEKDDEGKRIDAGRSNPVPDDGQRM